jgi:hypothetical protein
MQEPEHPSPDQMPDDSSVEITDLELPAAASPKLLLTIARHLLRWQHSLTHKQVRLAMGVAIFLLISLVLFFNIEPIAQSLLNSPNRMNSSFVRQPMPVNIKPSLMLLPQRDGFACLEDTAWSLDSRYLAFIGYQKQCSLSNNLYEPGLISVYDAHVGKMIDHFQPDHTILMALHSQFPRLQGNPVIYYSHILWSPNSQSGHSLILTFSASYLTSSAQVTVNGVLLANMHGTDRLVWLQLQNDNFPYVEWDLQSGQLVDTSGLAPVSTSLTGNTSTVLTYRWAADGSLIPQIEQIYGVQIGKTPFGPVGNPDGDAAFTTWQSGQVGLTNKVGTGPLHIPGVYTWNSSFAALSPGGRYLVEAVYVEGRLQLPGQPAPSVQTLKDFHLEQTPVLEVHDTGFQHVLKTLASAPDNLSDQAISWHPDGHLLATYDSGTVDLDLFNCVTGYQVASLQVPTSSTTALSGHLNWLHWSPDGRQVLLFDPQLGSVLLWHVP